MGKHTYNGRTWFSGGDAYERDIRASLIPPWASYADWVHWRNTRSCDGYTREKWQAS